VRLGPTRRSPHDTTFAVLMMSTSPSFTLLMAPPMLPVSSMMNVRSMQVQSTDTLGWMSGWKW
jgi:uncharacterized membrane protein YraQ (UPF0718 family)